MSAVFDAKPSPSLVTYDTHPDRYAHWKLAFDGAVATLSMDVNEDKVAMVNGGVSPVVEPGLPELVAEMVTSGRLRATTDTEAAIDGSDQGGG